ncbi:MAG: hypothetical protein AAGJ35_03825 [Myxococcota bacterium]
MTKILPKKISIPNLPTPLSVNETKASASIQPNRINPDKLVSFDGAKGHKASYVQTPLLPMNPKDLENLARVTAKIYKRELEEEFANMEKQYEETFPNKAITYKQYLEDVEPGLLQLL